MSLFVLAQLGIIVCVILLAYCTVYTHRYRSESIPEYNGVKLPFKKFIQFYHLNPNRYSIIYNHTKKWPKWVYESSLESRIYFGFFDYIRFCRWDRKRLKEKKDKVSNAQLAKYLSVVQKDIDEIRKYQTEYISIAEQYIQRIKETVNNCNN